MKSDNISPLEWRWVAIFSGILVALTLLPFAWALAASDSQYAFMGILPNPQDGATYISKIQQGREGFWLFELRHTPEPHDRAAFHMFYLALGQVANLLGVSNVLIFHLARIATSFFMFASLYQLGAAIWTRQRPRRLFFLLVSVGSGLGWLALFFDTTNLAPDMTVNEAFPLLAAYTNPHFPLAIGCMALIAEHLLTVFRPGFTESPTLENGGLLVIVLTLVLTLVSPPGALVLGGTLVVYTFARAYRTRKVPLHESQWSAMVLFPAFPFGMYYIAVFRFNDMMSQFNQQNLTPSPNLILFVFGYGLLLIIAVPGLARAFRRFEPDGDQFMLSWFVLNMLAVYLPGFGLQRRMFIGLIIPIVYFAVRALEDYWFYRIHEKWRAPALITVFVFILPTHAFTFGAPLAATVLNQDSGAENFLLLQSDYISAFDWLQENGKVNEVVLASPAVGLWIPARTSLRVVYGHPFETVPAEERRTQTEAFFKGENCDTLLGTDLPFSVKYVLWGPQEDALGRINQDASDAENLTPEDFEEDSSTEAPPRLPDADTCHEVLTDQVADQQTFGDVTLYILNSSTD